jgi:regulator of protease activity HflC (stomatin/prohibitin superfamily)
MWSSFVLIALVILVIFTVAKSIIVVRQQEAVVVERLGKFHTILMSGLIF